MRTLGSRLESTTATGGILPPRRLLTLTLLLMALCMSWYVHFWPHVHAANESVRLYFAQAVFETGRPELDSILRLHDSLPVDRSERGGHIYMDKAPGLSFGVLPIYAGLLALRPQVRRAELWLVGYLSCLLLVVLPFIFGLLAFGRWLRRGGASEREAGLATLATGMASPILVYSSLLLGHGLAAALIMIALFVQRPPPPEAHAGSARLLGAGLAAGLAGFVDTPVFMLAAMLCLFVWARADAPGWLGRTRAALPFVAGVAIFVLAQLLYNHWTLGHPLRFTDHHKYPGELTEILANGLAGVRHLSLRGLWGTWLSPARGLLYHAPWLLLGALGLAVVAVQGAAAARRDARWLLCMVLLYALLVSRAGDWQRDDLAGPRHLMPLIGLLAIGFVDGWRWLRERFPEGWRADAVAGAIATSLAVGLLFAALPVMTFPYHLHQLDHPVMELNLPLLLFFRGHSHSLGNAMGLGHQASALVFIVLLLTPWLLTLRLASRSGEPAGHGSGRQRWRMIALGLAAAVLWASALVAPIAEPGRAVQAARFRASRLLMIPSDYRENYRWFLRHRDDPR